MAVLLCTAFALRAAAAEPAPSSEPVSYNRDIRPILSENCYACHGPDAGKRKAGLRLDVKEDPFKKLESGHFPLVPGKLAESHLWKLITTADDEDRMPPVKSGKKLTAQQVATIKRWIEQGAKWEGHWAYSKVERPKVPEPKDKKLVRNEIDDFIEARLEKEGLKLSPEADRATLIRRVTLDLTGLPPTIDEVEQFLADKNDAAYEALVKRLLDSPRYGERMAQHWLDLARYADTNGYHIDTNREMWKWREWVIAAFNKNMPFDQFTTEQLAGDLLPNATLEQRIASGFNRNGMVNFEGGADPDEYASKYVGDRVTTTSTVFLGSTIACTECHDHKYDPFTQKDFYQLYAFFNNVPERGLDGNSENPVPSIRVPTPEQSQKLLELVQSLPEAEKAFKVKEAELPAAQTKWEKEFIAKGTSAPETEGYLARYTFDDTVTASDSSRSQKPAAFKGTNAPGWIEGKWGKGIKLSGNGDYVDAGNAADFDRNEAFSIGAWVKVEGKGGVVLSRMDTANGLRGYDLGVVDGKIWAHFISKWDTNALKVTTKEGIPGASWQHILVTYDGLGKAAGLKIYHNGKIRSVDINNDTLTGSFKSASPLIIGKRPDSLPFNGAIDDVRFYTRALSPEEALNLTLAPTYAVIAAAPEKRTEEQRKDLAKYFFDNFAFEYRDAEKNLNGLRQARENLLKEMPSTMVMQEMPEPRKTHVLVRGDFRKKGEQVFPNVPQVLPPLPEGPTNRLSLAKWLVAPNHPLTSRVTINRYWQLVFGTGLVKTSNDFGSQGDWPSHPELLDWLASEFMARNWDIKGMIKLMVTSAAYRQSTVVSKELLEKDPYNRLLSRGPRYRLDAEMIRDTALSVSGLLNPKMGGRSIFPYQPPGLWEEVGFGNGFSSQSYVQSKGEDLYRRGLYVYWKRAMPYPSFVTFDAPSREVCTVQRPRTCTPLQSLVLMNDPVYVEAARGFACRIMKEGGKDVAKRIDYAFRLVLSRSPREAESQVLQKLYRQQLENYTKDKAAAEALLSVGESPRPKDCDVGELAAWTALGSVILNLDEAITKG